MAVVERLLLAEVRLYFESKGYFLCGIWGLACTAGLVFMECERGTQKRVGEASSPFSSYT